MVAFWKEILKMTKSLNTRRKRLNFSKEPLLLKTIKNNKLNNEFNFRDAFLKSVFTNEPNLNTNEKEINILIAEDDEDDYFLISGALDEAFKPYKIHWAKDGQDTLDFMMNCIREDFLPDLMLLDINMPKINGIDLVKIIRERFSIQQVPIIMLSGSSSHSYINRAYEYGANSYLCKRDNYKDLVKLMKVPMPFGLILSKDQKIN